MRVGFLVAAALSFLAVIATFSRGGFLAGTTGLFTFAILQKHRLRWFGAMAVALVIVVSVALPDGYRDRLNTPYDQDKSSLGRLHYWRVALDMSMALPLGVGIQHFNEVYDLYDPSDDGFGTSRSVHNSHLQILTESGFLGFAAWLFLLFYSIVLSLLVRRRAKALPGDHVNRALYRSLGGGLAAVFVAFTVGGTFTAIGWNDLTWCLFSVVAALDRVSRADVQMATRTIECAKAA
jgi:O-antigen ligase